VWFTLTGRHLGTNTGSDPSGRRAENARPGWLNLVAAGLGGLKSPSRSDEGFARFRPEPFHQSSSRFGSQELDRLRSKSLLPIDTTGECLIGYRHRIGGLLSLNRAADFVDGADRPGPPGYVQFGGDLLDTGGIGRVAGQWHPENGRRQKAADEP